MSSQVTTITFFKYGRWSAKAWAFGMMQFAHRHLTDVEGQTFYRLMGTGRDLGFNPFPDWSVYALIQVWENEKCADAFLQKHPLMGRYRQQAREVWSVYMKCKKAKGYWVGKNPFEISSTIDLKNNHQAIITRATIRTSRLVRFWRYVPTSEKPLMHNSGLLFTKGIGEVPVVQMATFSIWRSEEALAAFAYKSREHAGAIRKTRELNWYSEEMFARFQPYRTEGTWNGKNPLEVGLA